MVKMKYVSSGGIRLGFECVTPSVLLEGGDKNLLPEVLLEDDGSI